MTDDGLYTEGDRVRVRCDYGYELWGDARITCQASGNWSGALPFIRHPPYPSYPPLFACLGKNNKELQFISVVEPGFAHDGGTNPPVAH